MNYYERSVLTATNLGADTMNYELHPLCTLFPRMPDAEFKALADDIRTNGLLAPIVLHDGMILDGGNRYRACLEAGIEPSFNEFDGDNLVSFVLSVNLHRRHMTAGQQAAIVASAQDWAKAQTRGGDRKTDQSATWHFDPALGSDPTDADQSSPPALETVADRAAQSGASVRTQKRADKVAKADPELAKQVAHGEISLPAAVRQIENKPPKSPAPLKLEIVSDEVAELRAEIERLKEWGEENARTAKELIADNESMAIVFEADDKLAAAMAEIKKYRELVRVLTERNNGLLNAESAAKKAATKWQLKCDRLQKSIETSRHAA